MVSTAFIADATPGTYAVYSNYFNIADLPGPKPAALCAHTRARKMTTSGATDILMCVQVASMHQ